MTDPQTKRRILVRLLAAFGIALTLSGCVFVPVGPGYHRPPRYYYY